MPDPTPQLKSPHPPTANTTRNTHETVAGLLASHAAHRVLDAPCGEGALAWKLLQRGMEPYCLDCDPEACQVEGVDFRAGNLAEPLDYPDGFFDAVACVDGIEHLENPFLAVREFCRVLRRGGLLVVSTPNISAMRSRFRFLLTGCHNKFKRPLNEASPSPAHHISPLTYPWLRYVLHISGFHITAVRTNRIKAASYPYAILWPFAALCTCLSFRREKDPGQRLRNREIAAALLGPAVFFGETLIVAAEKN